MDGVTQLTLARRSADHPYPVTGRTLEIIPGSRLAGTRLAPFSHVLGLHYGVGKPGTRAELAARRGERRRVLFASLMACLDAPAHAYSHAFSARWYG